MLARFSSALLSASFLAGAHAFAAEPRLVASFDDPAGDATGPGTYVPPTAPAFGEGTFDLRGFAVYVDGDDVLLEVTLGAAIRPPDAAQRGAEIPPDLGNGIYLQNVDIYVDSDPRPGSGHSVGLPGRRIAFAGGRMWETAIVLTPQPAAARAAVAEALGPAAAAHVLFPGPLEVRGGTLVARVPAAALGGPPRNDWGWSVQVSGARWERAGAPHAADALTMPVLVAPGAWHFGGGPPGEVHPRVVDVLLPPGADQRAVLGSFDASTGAFARVPFVYAVPPAGQTNASAALAPAPTSSLAARPAAATPSLAPAATVRAAGSGPVLTVAEVSEDMVTLAGPNIGLVSLQLGRVIDRDGATVALVVIDRVLENGVVARIVSGRENVRWGARVRFDAQTIKR
jgi:C-terminal binding-module, SLH-like, of glucodextranase